MQGTGDSLPFPFRDREREDTLSSDAEVWGVLRVARRPHTVLATVFERAAAVDRAHAVSAMTEPAGYSGTPLPKKLGIKPGHRVRFAAAPPEFFAALGELPPDVQVLGEGDGDADLDLIVFFTTSGDELRARYEGLAASLDAAGMLWVAWPKKASGVRTDVTEDVVRQVALERGMVDTKVCAIDATWSGLKLVRRLKDRPGR